MNPKAVHTSSTPTSFFERACLLQCERNLHDHLKSGGVDDPVEGLEMVMEIATPQWLPDVCPAQYPLSRPARIVIL